MSKFLDAKAPMTAKCIIRDMIAKLDAEGAERWTVKAIEELAFHGYVIVSAPEPSPTTTRRRQKRIAP